MDDDKVRENRLRRVADRQGLRLMKSRRRDPHATDFGTYMLVNVQTGGVDAADWGSFTKEYGLDLDDIEEWLSEPPAERKATKPAPRTRTRKRRT